MQYGEDPGGQPAGRRPVAVVNRRLQQKCSWRMRVTVTRSLPLLWSVYSLRNLWARRVTTLLTLSGLGLVVFVFVAILMLAHGLERTMGRTGDPAPMPFC
jgi:hypothetical protein